MLKSLQGDYYFSISHFDRTPGPLELRVVCQVVSLGLISC
jgi:hypothetical protein